MKKGISSKTKNLLIFSAALLVVAVVLELLFVGISNRHDESDYVLSSVGASSFTSWEFEDKGNGNYYALAYNSYLTADDLGGARADKIEVFLSRTTSDSTETVIYYTGKVNGIYGEFIAPLTLEREGVYVGYLGADSLDRIRICPTEIVHSTITFDGVVINPDVSVASFSVARIILWGMLCAMLYSLYIIIRFFAFKKGERPNLWLIIYFCLGGALMLASYEGTRMFTSVRGLEGIILPVVFVLFSLLYAALWFIAVRLREPHKKLCAAVAVLGVMFTFALSPLQAPDEQNHFLRAYAISGGQLNFEFNYEYPGDVQLLFDSFKGQFYLEKHEKGLATTISQISMLLTTDATSYKSDYCHSDIQLLLPYIPAAIGIGIVRLVGGNALFCLYAARLMNVAVFAICAYLALKNAARYRGAIILAALLPLTLFMAATTSYDSMFLSAFILMFGLICKNNFRQWDLLAVVALFSVMISIKPIYFPLAFLILTIPKSEYKPKTNKISALLLILGFGAIVYLGSLIYADLFASNIPPTVYLDGVDKLSQIKYVLSNPVRYAMVMVVDGYLNSFYLNTFGDLGALDVHCILTNLLSPVLVVVVAALYADTAKRYKKSDAVIFSVITVASYAIIVTGFYAMWSTLGSTSILGVQSRYFITLVPLLAALISKALSKAISFNLGDRSRDNATIAICGGLSFVAAFEMFARYFLM